MESVKANSPFRWSIERGSGRAKLGPEQRSCVSLFMDHSLMYTIMITLRRHLKQSIDKRETRAERLKVPLEKYSRTNAFHQRIEAKQALSAKEKLLKKREEAKKALRNFSKTLQDVAALRIPDLFADNEDEKIGERGEEEKKQE